MEKKTVSFSAALHEMLTLGARVRLPDWEPDEYIEIRDGTLFAHRQDGTDAAVESLQAYAILSTNWEIIGSDIGKTTFTPAQ